MRRVSLNGKVDSFVADVLGLPDPLTAKWTDWTRDMIARRQAYDDAVAAAMNDQMHSDAEKQQVADLWQAFKAYHSGEIGVEAWAAVKARCTSTWWMHVLAAPYNARPESDRYKYMNRISLDVADQYWNEL